MRNVYSASDPKWQNMDKSKFVLVQTEEKILDATFESKPIGFFKDAALRFVKSKVSIAALVGIIITIFFSI